MKIEGKSTFYFRIPEFFPEEEALEWLYRMGNLMHSATKLPNSRSDALIQMTDRLL
jgi:hypothetical protein